VRAGLEGAVPVGRVGAQPDLVIRDLDRAIAAFGGGGGDRP